MPDIFKINKTISYKHYTSIFLALLVFASYFALLGYLPLFEPDEGRYAEISREMLVKGDFITPTLNYVKYFEKPVLHYWLTAGAFKLFGQNEFAARFFPAVFALLGIAGVYLLAKKLYSEKVGVTAAFVLSGSVFWYIVGRVNVIDMEVSSMISLSLISFLLWEKECKNNGKQEHENSLRCGWSGFLVGYYGFAALATLSKGLIGLVFPGGIVFWYLVGTRRLGRFRMMGLWWGLPLYLLIITPWFIAVSLKNPEFLWFFFVHEHFLRYISGTSHTEANPFYYIPILIAGLLPFTGYLVPALKNPLKHIWKSRLHEGQLEFFLILWMVIILLFFSFSQSKLPTYILPVFPPAAILIGRYIAEHEAEWAGRGVLLKNHFLGIGGALVFPIAMFVFPFVQKHSTLDNAFLYSILPFILTMAAIGCAVWWGRMGRRGISVWLFTATAGLILGATPAIKKVFGPYRSVKTISKTAGALAKNESIIALEHYWQGLPFYARRRVVIVNYRGELDFGINHAKDKDQWFWNSKRFFRKWHSNHRLWVMISDEGLAERCGQKGPTVKEMLGKYSLMAREGYVNVITNTSRCGLLKTPSSLLSFQTLNDGCMPIINYPTARDGKHNSRRLKSVKRDQHFCEISKLVE